MEDTEVEKFGLDFNDDSTTSRVSIFKLQKHKKRRCNNKSFRQHIFPIRCIVDWNALEEERGSSWNRYTYDLLVCRPEA